MSFNLSKPYPQSTPLKSVRSAGIIALFVIGFLSVFQPFGMSAIENIKTKYIIFLGFGGITFFTASFLGVVPRLIFKQAYSPINWSTGKEIVHVGFNFLLVGGLNFWFAVWVFGFETNFITFLSFEGITLLVGGIPFSIMVLLRHNRLLQQNESSAVGLNQQLNLPHETQPDQTITIESDLKEESLTLAISNFLVAISSDNYVEIFHTSDEEVQKTVLRMPLKKLEAQLMPFENLVRCHRSYLVNLEHVSSFSGNAQGLKLTLKKMGEPISVSRSYVPTIKSHLG